MREDETDNCIGRMEKQLDIYHNEGGNMEEVTAVTLEDINAQLELMRQELGAIKQAIAAKPAAAAAPAATGMELRSYPVGLIRGDWEDRTSSAGKSYTKYFAYLSNGKSVNTFNKELAKILDTKVGQEVTITESKKGEYWDLFGVV